MNSFAILADANCDLSAEFQKQYGIEVIPTHIVYPGNRERTSFLDWTGEDRKGYYAALKARPDDFHTAPPNVQEFKDAIEAQLRAGKDVLGITISAGISGCFGFMNTAVKELAADWPQARIRVVDSRCFGPGFGLMAIHTALRRAEGMSLDETADWLEANKRRFHQAGWLDDLSFVAKKGRISHAKAIMGTFAGVKPIGEFDTNGLTTVLAKARGAKQAYSALLQYVAGTIEDAGSQIIFIAHTDRQAQAEQYKAMLEEKFHPKAVYISECFPSCSINIGPGLMAAYYMGRPLTDDLAAEKAILEKALAAK